MSNDPDVDAEVLEPQDALILREDFVDRFEAGAVQVRRFLAACIRMTHARQWVNHGSLEKPQIQLQGPGAECLATPLGVAYNTPPSIKRVNIVESDSSMWYAYEVEGWLNCERLKRRGYYMAVATSKDKFFAAKPGFDASRDYIDVQNKAMTHWLATGTARLCGLRNPDPALLEAGGIKVADIPRIDYTGSRTFESAGDLISEAQTKLLYAKYKQQNIPEETFRAKLKSLGAVDEKGSATTKAVRKRDLDGLLRWIEAGGQEGPPAREPGQEG